MPLSGFMEAFKEKNIAEESLKQTKQNLAQATQENLAELFERRLVSISYNKRRIERML